jgi:hypothetical protein
MDPWAVGEYPPEPRCCLDRHHLAVRVEVSRRLDPSRTAFRAVSWVLSFTRWFARAVGPRHGGSGRSILRSRQGFVRGSAA